jgi:hypothetical protein
MSPVGPAGSAGTPPDTRAHMQCMRTLCSAPMWRREETGSFMWCCSCSSRCTRWWAHAVSTRASMLMSFQDILEQEQWHNSPISRHYAFKDQAPATEAPTRCMHRSLCTSGAINIGFIPELWWWRRPGWSTAPGKTLQWACSQGHAAAA